MTLGITSHLPLFWPCLNPLARVPQEGWLTGWAWVGILGGGGVEVWGTSRRQVVQGSVVAGHVLGEKSWAWKPSGVSGSISLDGASVIEPGGIVGIPMGRVGERDNRYPCRSHGIPALSHCPYRWSLTSLQLD